MKRTVTIIDNVSLHNRRRDIHVKRKRSTAPAGRNPGCPARAFPADQRSAQPHVCGKIQRAAASRFDKRLDQELDEEKAERRRQLLLQAPNFKLLNMMVENEKYSQELAAKLKDGGLYYLRSREEENVEPDG